MKRTNEYKTNTTYSTNNGKASEALDALSRAVSILEKEMAKNPASFAQVDASDIKHD